ncbi:hypothetical protein C0991_009989 [Blastosporella zonata]|nr:hypothetical protein C0991_009989 [Blastosporella zonata]
MREHAKVFGYRPMDSRPKIKRKPPPVLADADLDRFLDVDADVDINLNIRYPTPDPSDPFAPLWVLRSRGSNPNLTKRSQSAPPSALFAFPVIQDDSASDSSDPDPSAPLPKSQWPTRITAVPLPIPPSTSSFVHIPSHCCLPPPTTTEWTLPTHPQLAHAASLPVVAPSGLRVPFSTLFAERPTVVIFLRHFWCPFCQDYASSVARAAPTATLLTSPNKQEVRVLLISNGAPAFIEKYRTMLGLQCDIYTDPRNELYEALGMGRIVSKAPSTSPQPSYVRHGAVGGLAMVVVRALKAALPIWERGGDIHQLGGEFVMGPGCVAFLLFFTRFQFTHYPQITMYLRPQDAIPQRPRPHRRSPRRSGCLFHQHPVPLFQYHPIHRLKHHAHPRTPAQQHTVHLPAHPLAHPPIRLVPPHGQETSLLHVLRLSFPLHSQGHIRKTQSPPQDHEERHIPPSHRRRGVWNDGRGHERSATLPLSMPSSYAHQSGSSPPSSYASPSPYPHHPYSHLAFSSTPRLSSDRDPPEPRHFDFPAPPRHSHRHSVDSDLPDWTFGIEDEAAWMRERMAGLEALRERKRARRGEFVGYFVTGGGSLSGASLTGPSPGSQGGGDWSESRGGGYSDAGRASILGGNRNVGGRPQRRGSRRGRASSEYERAFEVVEEADDEGEAEVYIQHGMVKDPDVTDIMVVGFGREDEEEEYNEQPSMREEDRSYLEQDEDGRYLYPRAI